MTPQNTDSKVLCTACKGLW